MMENSLCSNQPVRCIICGPSSLGKSVFPTNLNLNIVNENDKIYIYSPSLPQDLFQKIIKCFSNFMRTHMIPNILNDKNIDVVIEEIVSNKDFEKSDIEIEIYESKEDLNFP